MKFILLLFLLTVGYAQEFTNRSLSLLVWNIQKGKKSSWNRDFEVISKEKDLILLQEALMTDQVVDTISLVNYQWELGKSFSYFGNDTGVLTLSKIDPFDSKIVLSSEKEPISNTSKATLISFFSIENHHSALMVINTHGINFVSTKKFKSNIDQIAHEIAQHDGPLIWAGDINSWNSSRLEILYNTAAKYRLTPIVFAPGAVKTGPLPWNKVALDHIFFRGLELTNSSVLENISSSDHKPLQASFVIPIR